MAARIYAVRMSKAKALGHAWAALKGELLVGVLACPQCDALTVIAYGDKVADVGRDCGHA